ncbi:MAG: glycosyltransferase, partial [Kiritimatiellae bacterium]|nr:glycosyltransferase [Kiritimatiellia bacterium]
RARRVYREADLVTGVCDRYRALTGRADYFRAYLGAEGRPALPAPAPSADGSVRLVYSGNLGRSYDLATVVEAVRADESLSLDVAGFGEFAADCPRVRFHGLLSAQGLRDLYARCDAGVVPMRGDSWVGVPNKVFDYAEAGLAIVSSLGGETEELISANGCGATYSPGDAASLAEAVRRAAALPRGASRRLFEREFDAAKIYDGYVKRILR